MTTERTPPGNNDNELAEKARAYIETARIYLREAWHYANQIKHTHLRATLQTEIEDSSHETP